MLTTIILVLLICMLIGALPNFGYAQGWGPFGGLSGLVVLLLILLLLGVI